MLKEMACGKIVTFDLSTAKLLTAGFSDVFPDSLIPYKQIRAEMGDLGFIHLQKSVYNSKFLIRNADLMEVLAALNERLPWFDDCVSLIHTADIVNEQVFDLKDALDIIAVTQKLNGQ